MSFLPSISVKTLKGTQITNPNRWPGLILSSSSTALLTEEALLRLRWLSETLLSISCVPGVINWNYFLSVNVTNDDRLWRVTVPPVTFWPKFLQFRAPKFVLQLQEENSSCPLLSKPPSFCEVKWSTRDMWRQSGHNSAMLLSRVSVAQILTDWVKVLRRTRHKIGHFGDVLPSQSVIIVLKKLNLTQ